MPMFSQASFSKLSTCHIDLQTIFFEVIREMDCQVITGFRDEKEQNEAFLSGKSKIKWPDGKHNSKPSMAVDVAPYPIDWNNLQRFCWFGGYVMGTAEKLLHEGKISHKVRWGGLWDGMRDGKNFEIGKQDFNDYTHFELV